MIKNLLQLKYIGLFSLSMVLFISSSLYAQMANKKSNNIRKASTSKPEIAFIESSWDSVMKKATATHKYIFVDANGFVLRSLQNVKSNNIPG